MSALGQKQTWERPSEMSAKCQKWTIREVSRRWLNVIEQRPRLLGANPGPCGRAIRAVFRSRCCTGVLRRLGIFSGPRCLGHPGPETTLPDTVLKPCQVTITASVMDLAVRRLPPGEELGPKQPEFLPSDEAVLDKRIEELSAECDAFIRRPAREFSV